MLITNRKDTAVVIIRERNHVGKVWILCILGA